MSDTRKGCFSAKHAAGAEPDERIAEAVRARKCEEGLSCAKAFGIAEDLGVAPSEVGRALDLMETRILRCQLGLFGYHPAKRLVKPAETISEELHRAIGEGLVNDRLPCKTAWDIALIQKIPRMAVADACEKMSIKIKPCQLGSF